LLILSGNFCGVCPVLNRATSFADVVYLYKKIIEHQDQCIGKSKSHVNNSNMR